MQPNSPPGLKLCATESTSKPDNEGKMRMELTVEETSTLGSLSGVIAMVDKLLASGVTVAQLAETVAKFADPSIVPALAVFITVLQEAEALLKKA
jgi:hypothetical protein